MARMKQTVPFKRGVRSLPLPSESPPPAKKPRLSFASGLDINSPPLKIIVGPGANAQEYYAHENALKTHSDFFIAATKEGWKEGKERVVRLPDEDPNCFEVFVRYLYDGNLHLADEQGDDSDSNSAQWDIMVQCWFLGDRLLSASFKDCVTNGLQKKCDEDLALGNDLYKLAYPKTARANGLRRLAVDIAIFNGGSKSFKDAAMDPSWNEFFRDVAIRYSEFGPIGHMGDAPFGHADSCYYHEHQDDDYCPSSLAV